MSSPSNDTLRARTRTLATSAVAYRLAIGALVALAFALTFWNAYAAPGHLGYDSEQNVHHAHDIVHEWEFNDPNTYGDISYKPPGFYVLAGGLLVVGEQLHLKDPRSVVQFADGLLAVASLVVVLLLARTLWPGRRARHGLAGAFFLFMPLIPKTAAMFHPALLGTFISALALLLAARMLEHRRFDLRSSIVLLAVLLGGLVTMSAGVWTYGAVVGGVLAAGLGRHSTWRQLRVPLVVLVGLAAAVAIPWYAHQASARGTLFFSGAPNGGTESFLTRKPPEFYFDSGWPQVVERPIRPAYTNRLLPTAYTETWGDYFGIWAWAAESPPDARTMRELRQQSWLGLLPTALGIGGWLALLYAAARATAGRRLRHPGLVPVALLPGVALLGFLYYGIGFYSIDGDLLKGTYMITATPAWAIAFAWAADRVRRLPVVGLPAVLVLAGSALLSLPFLVYHSPLWGLL